MPGRFTGGLLRHNMSRIWVVGSGPQEGTHPPLVAPKCWAVVG
jgi:hypothetical protein